MMFLHKCTINHSTNIPYIQNAEEIYKTHTKLTPTGLVMEAAGGSSNQKPKSTTLPVTYQIFIQPRGMYLHIIPCTLCQNKLNNPQIKDFINMLIRRQLTTGRERQILQEIIG